MTKKMLMVLFVALFVFAVGCLDMVIDQPFCDEIGGRECVTSGDCDDSNSCTVDICDVGNVCQHTPDSTCLPEPQCEVDEDCDPFNNLCYEFSCVEGSCRGHEWDVDGDGFTPCGMIECDDFDPAQHLGAPEICNAEDDDCDGFTDEDCDDCVPEDELCGDNVDNDCDRSVDEGCPCSLDHVYRLCGSWPPPANYCFSGMQSCDEGILTECIGGLPAGEEDCGFPRRVDADCDGLWNDEDPDCDPSSDCVPTEEICDGLDNDCDGLTDEDCPPVCGDHRCNGDETESCSTCPVDCGSCPPVCGDRSCNGDETCATCSLDCGTCPPRCDDGTCNGDETCLNCPSDCGDCGYCTSSADCDDGEPCTDDLCVVDGICHYVWSSDPGCDYCVPDDEVCNGLDDDCDGEIDEDCP
jgi:hypothetical protein